MSSSLEGGIGNVFGLLLRGRFISFCLRFLMLILGTQRSGIFSSAATVAIAIATSATSLTPPVATPAATPAIAGPFAAATPSDSVPRPAVGHCGTAFALFLRDR